MNTHLIKIVTLLTIVLQTTLIVAQDQNSKAKEAMTKAKADFEAGIEKLKNAVKEVESKEEQMQLFQKLNPNPSYVQDLIGIATDYADTSTGLEALLEATSKLKGSDRDPAMMLMIEKYADRVDLAKIAKYLLEEMPSIEAEKWLRGMRRNAPDDETKASVTMTLCEYRNRMVRYQIALDDNPQMEEMIGEEQVAYIRKDQDDAFYVELAEMLDWVAETEPRFAKKSASLKTELTCLRVGQKAPEVIGEDLDGNEVRLSDYQGKVVMFRFWGNWCPHCRAMYDHEQFLAQSLKGEPFALLGVNSDRNLETARRVVRDEGLTWRHIWNGPKGSRGGVAEEWNIESWPTIYLIDSEGVIRAKLISYANLDRKIEELLAEMDREVKIEYEHSE